METWRLEELKKTDRGRSTRIRHLTAEECSSLRSSLGFAVGVGTTASGLEILDQLAKLGAVIRDATPSASGFLLSRVLEQAGVDASVVYTNWAQFDDMDEIEVNDLSQIFDEIWSPDRDDVEIFDSTLKWFLLVRHYDAIEIVRV